MQEKSISSSSGINQQQRQRQKISRLISYKKFDY